MASLTNKLIANIKKTSSDFNTSNFIDSNNVVVIDTQYNRIGINTKDPSAAIHIVKNTNDDHESGKIICDTIQINNITYATLNSSSSSSSDSLSFTTISYDDLDVSYHIIDLSSIKKNNITINANYNSINITEFNTNNIYEINSNINLKYSTDLSNDSIFYDFIIYQDNNTNINNIVISNIILKNKNSIILDQSNIDYYSSSHLNYIGTLDYSNIFFIITISNNDVNDIDKLDNLKIDNLNSTIRLLNN
tara:strand:- start:943 stop:1689 length:747 start_codon:yes stop_codon:yes gene_type:complete